MGIQIPGEVWKEWQCLRKMRNALAHGNMRGYGQIKDPNGLRFASERDRAEFAYKTAVRFIYEIRYSGIEERDT